jgi:hypothetical protein
VATARGTATVGSTGSGPEMVMGSLTTNFGGMLKFTVKGTQHSSPVTVEADLSAELVLKS